MNQDFIWIFKSYEWFSIKKWCWRIIFESINNLIVKWRPLISDILKIRGAAITVCVHDTSCLGGCPLVSFLLCLRMKLLRFKVLTGGMQYGYIRISICLRAIDRCNRYSLLNGKEISRPLPKSRLIKVIHWGYRLSAAPSLWNNFTLVYSDSQITQIESEQCQIPGLGWAVRPWRS